MQSKKYTPEEMDLFNSKLEKYSLLKRKSGKVENLELLKFLFLKIATTFSQILDFQKINFWSL